MAVAPEKFHQRNRRLLSALSAIITLTHISIAAAQESRSTARIVLNDDQLDRVTAGVTGISLMLAAYAAGATAVSTTEGFVRTARTTILIINVDPSTGANPPRLVDEVPADVVIAAGQATAVGDSDARCFATINNPNNLAFVIQTEMQTVTSTSALCSCSFFGINLLR